MCIRDSDKVVCLELGADDFIVKPFDMNELFARIKAVLRRCNSHEEPGDSEVIKFENIEISKQKYELKLKGKSIDIPPKELELLYFLASNYNRVFTRDQLLDKVWGFDYLGDSRTVEDVYKRQFFTFIIFTLPSDSSAIGSASKPPPQ